MAKEKDQVFAEAYDGIQEYDNDLPRWWVYLFYCTIVFSVGYAAYYHLGPGLGQEELLALDMKAFNDAKAANAPKQPAQQDLLALAGDSAALAKGKEVYGEVCGLSRRTGAGADRSESHRQALAARGTLEAIKHTIESGVVAKGMLAWKGVLPDADINAVTAYIWSIRDSNPPNPKGPEGEPVS